MWQINHFVESSEDKSRVEVKELLKYILHEPASEKEYPNGIRDKGRAGEKLEHFLNHPKAKKASLTEAEV